MKKLSVDFYGEKVSIDFPKDFTSLKKEISKKYQLSLSDVSEIDISYLKNEQKKVIKTEVDYKTFAHARIFDITLDISEKSSLYQKSLLDLKNKGKDDLERLAELKKKKEENQKKQELESAECKKKIEELNAQIKELGQQKLVYVKSIKKVMKSPKNKEKELVDKISKLGKEIGAPLVFQMPEKGPLPVKGETEKEKNLLELIQKNTECVNSQEKLVESPRKKVTNVDKEIKEKHKMIIAIIKNSQKEIVSLKKERNNLIKEIIDLEKSLGLNVDEKKPMLKTGFYIPNRKEVQIKTVKKEGEIKPKIIKKKPEIKLSFTAKKNFNKKVDKLVNTLGKYMEIQIEDNFIESKNEFTKTKEFIKRNKIKITAEDEKCLENCKKEKEKSLKEVDKWLEFIMNHKKEIIEAAEKSNEENCKKLEELRNKYGSNYNKIMLENLISPKKFHPGVLCNGCNGPIIGARYKCAVCADFDFCEKCEENNKGQHGHPMLKINNPEQCPLSIQCVMKEENN